jgi:oxygen-independent coproporphyrinogen-3 oxidase
LGINRVSHLSNNQTDVFSGPLTPLSIYVHLPFCEKKCFYCDFYSEIVSPEIRESYLQLIRRELLLREDEFKGRQVLSVYFGGGTPSLIRPESMTGLFAFIKEHSLFIPECECTIEGNPGSITKDKLQYWKDSGINRLSLGVQSFSDTELATLGRIHSARQIQRTIEALDATSWNNFSLDLIFGIPGQTDRSWKSNLQKAVQTGAPHLSVYGLTCEPDTPLFSMVKNGTIVLPSAEDHNRMFLTAHDFLTAEGFEHYEISNYARPGYKSVHNSHYWKHGSYLGLGAGAYSAIHERRFANKADLNEYRLAIEAGTFPEAWSETLTPSKLLTEKIMLGLRTNIGIDLTLLKGFGFDLDHDKEGFLLRLEHGALIERSGQVLRATPRGMLVLNEIIRGLMESI